ncbi:MAG TPA: HTH domain-containing protein [Steroidobacteraceae bacterium]
MTIEVMGERQKQLLRLLLRNKGGMTVDELARELHVTRNAVRQHLAALSEDGFVAVAATRPTAGRPQRLHVLTDAGKEAFPRHYSWFAQMLVDAVESEHGAEGLRTRLGRIAATVASQMRERVSGDSLQGKVERAAAMMDELGYDARFRPGGNNGSDPGIEADNCVFHQLARKNPMICHFDVTLLSGITDANVELQECMVRGGHVCRFRFAPRK